MKEQFTQGEWLNEGTTVYALQDSTRHGKPIKINRFQFNIQGKCSDEELLANAILAKAAPKMYEFLKRVHTLKDCDMDYAISWIMDNANDIGDLLDEARGEK